MNEKIAKKIVIIVAVVTLVVVGIIIFKPKKKVELPQVTENMGNEEIAQAMNQLSISQKAKLFEKLSDEQRRSFMRNPNATEEERKQNRQNMMAIHRYQMNQKMKKFFSATKAEQNQMLDEDLARMDKMKDKGNRGRGPQRGNNSSNNNSDSGKRRAPTAEQRREHEASMNPSNSAQMIMYRAALKARADEKK